MRTGTPAQQAALFSDATSFCLLVKLDISPPVYICSMDYDLQWDGHTWLGAGGMAFMEEIKEQTALEMTTLRVGLNGTSSANMALAMLTPMQGRLCTVYFAVLDANHRPVDTPMVEYKGYIDAPAIVDDRMNSKLTISITVESRLGAMLQKRSWRFTDADQQKLYPGDKFFEFIPQMTEKVFAWGKRYGK